MQTFDLSDGALDTRAMHSHHMRRTPSKPSAALRLTGVKMMATARLANTLVARRRRRLELIRALRYLFIRRTPYRHRDI